MTPTEFIQKFPHSALLTQSIYPRDLGFSTKICFHNYYERILKTAVDCELYTFVMDEKGKCVDSKKTLVASDCSVQVEVSSIKGHGLVAVGVVPLIDLKSFAEKMPIKKKQLCGYYTIWAHQEKTFMDTSHEWWPVYSDAAVPDQSFFAQPLDGPDFINRSLIIYNPSLNDVASCAITAGAMNENIQIPPLGCHEVFFKDWKSGKKAIEIKGRVAAPLTVEYLASGDLHIHHS